MEILGKEIKKERQGGVYGANSWVLEFDMGGKEMMLSAEFETAFLLE